MALYFPSTPVQDQKYVGINGITYIWIDNRWNGDLVLAEGQAEYYIDNSDAFFIFDPELHFELDGGTA